jgi:hypothetical protein
MTHIASKKLPLLLGLVVLAALFTLQRAGDRSHAAVSPTMHANVAEDASISLTFDDGTQVGSQARTPPTIPAGTYTIRVSDTAVSHNFHLFGPGVDQKTPIDEQVNTSWTVTFQPGQTYTFVCDDHTDFMYGNFQTSGTASGGSSSGGSSSGGSSSGGSSSGGTSSGGSSSGGSSSGGTSSTLKGTFVGTVSAGGKLALTWGGEPVKKIKAGKYKITVGDKGKTQAFVLQKKGAAPKTLTTAPFVGTKSVTVTFTAGSWSVYSAASGKKTTFTVS